MLAEPALYIFFFLLGAIFGSFLNVVILRLPHKDESIAFPASHCPKCKSQLKWYENIPLLSYLILRGKCGHCRAGISLQYPFVELSMALLSVALFYTFKLSLDTAGYFLLSSAFLVIIFIDIHHQIIPDLISLPGIIAGFIFSLVSTSVSWQSSLLGILFGGGILYGLAMLYTLLRKTDGMGGGDIKLLAMIGAWLGWQALPFVIFASSFSGSIIGVAVMVLKKKDSQTRIPFGPFLSVAALVYIFCSTQIHHYFHLYITGQWP